MAGLSLESVLQPNLDELEDRMDTEIPACWSVRPGDRFPDDIFFAVGRAMTRWERVEVSLLEVLISLQPQATQQNKIVRKFGRRRDTQQRVELVAEQFRRNELARPHIQISERQISFALKSYIKWKIARNRIAHGVVIMTGPTMMNGDPNGNVNTYQLHPSEGDQRSWMIPWKVVHETESRTVYREGNTDDDYINDGPIFSYKAHDIERISRKFVRVDHMLRAITRRLAAENDGADELLEALTVNPDDLSN